MPDFLEPFRIWFQDPRGIRKLLISLAWCAGAILSMIILGLILNTVLITLYEALSVLGWAVSMLVLLLGWLLVWLPFAGYVIRLLQNVQSGTVHPLPEWEYLWEDAGTGFRYLLALFLWHLPLLLLLTSLALVMDLDLSDLISDMADGTNGAAGAGCIL